MIQPYGDNKLLQRQVIFLLIIVGVIIAIVVIAGIAGGSKESGSSSTIANPEAKQSAPAKVEAIETSPQELFNTYDSNEVKADNTYKGKLVRLSGEVNDIGKDILDEPYVTLSVDGFMGIQIYFKSSEEKKIAELDKGQSITIVGKCDGKFMNVKIKDAVFE
jgi:hypothetical protein